jgi:hypothetical protein
MLGKLTTLDISPVAEYGAAPNAPQRVLWKWSVAVTAAILLFLMWQCGSALYHARALSNTAIREFHQHLNSGQYEQIYLTADQGFAQEDKHDELVRFLEAVHRRFGDARTENLINVNVNATTDGTFIVAQYNTTFAQGSATETFSWLKRWGTLKLHGYRIQPNGFILDQGQPAAENPDAVDLENGNLHVQVPVRNAKAKP